MGFFKSLNDVQKQAKEIQKDWDGPAQRQNALQRMAGVETDVVVEPVPVGASEAIIAFSESDDRSARSLARALGERVDAGFLDTWRALV